MHLVIPKAARVSARLPQVACTWQFASPQTSMGAKKISFHLKKKGKEDYRSGWAAGFMLFTQGGRELKRSYRSLLAAIYCVDFWDSATHTS